MKSILSLFTFLFLLFLSTNAQPPKGMGSSDPQAKKILDAVSTRFKSYKSVKAGFSLKIENASGKNIGTKTGNVFMKGSRYKVNITGQEIFSDGNNTWTYDKGAKEVTINKIDPTVNSITPQKLFTNFYDKDFLYKLNGVVTLNGKKVQEIELTPVDKTKPFHKVLLYINNNNITTTKIFEKTGNRYTYSITNMNTTTNIPDNTFVFDPKNYPGVEVVDLR
ncbi:MAG: outer membrane lipoprotein carrier protein LolA [Chitinophagaceae bacterium]|nr:outer membrane lipoprotein carrier protein LolA [Bacteroidota bacterium]MCC6256770.1 outer membrane lipoprotein carrier protein LolA [Chitinophagaceae bacterium]MCW5915807.1 outer membrane lipoprotein carrier protein LolA [Ferruginibacter sp.]